MTKVKDIKFKGFEIESLYRELFNGCVEAYLLSVDTQSFSIEILNTYKSGDVIESGFRGLSWWATQYAKDAKEPIISAFRNDAEATDNLAAFTVAFKSLRLQLIFVEES